MNQLPTYVVMVDRESVVRVRSLRHEHVFSTRLAVCMYMCFRPTNSVCSIATLRMNDALFSFSRSIISARCISSRLKRSFGFSFSLFSPFCAIDNLFNRHSCIERRKQKPIFIFVLKSSEKKCSEIHFSGDRENE